jgi:hypothetical protein
MNPTHSVQAIIDEAIAKTGISDIGDDWFLGPLGAWADDLEQANLNEGGRRYMSAASHDILDRGRSNSNAPELVSPPPPEEQNCLRLVFNDASHECAPARTQTYCCVTGNLSNTCCR